jgi:hypothetical protein
MSLAGIPSANGLPARRAEWGDGRELPLNTAAPI